MSGTQQQNPEETERRLAAIVFTDVAGYSARMQRDETGTMALVRADFERMRALCAQHGGEVLKSTGDGLLLCFSSVVQAVACALAVQAEFTGRGADALQHRIGIHLGDVFRQDGDVTGDGVNIAARLQTKARPGTICLSQSVYDAVKGKLPMQVEPLGPQQFKNITAAIRVYLVVTDGAAMPAATSPRAKWPIVATLAVMAAALAVFFWPKPAPVTPAANAPAKADSSSVLSAKALATAEALAKEDKSIAVLPFTNMSDDRDNAYFADGVHEDILTNLAHIAELRVVSRTSVMQYRETKKSISQIAAELHVAYVLEGSVRRAGNVVRVTGQLIRAGTDEHIWAQAYDRELKDIFAIQAALAQEIASALSVAITPQAQKFIERRPTGNPVAYDAFLKGRELRNTAIPGQPAPLRQAQADFQTAVDQDPKFAAAWGELAVAHALHAFWEIDNSSARLARGDAAIARAVQLAPDAPDVIAQIGTYAYYAHRDYARAAEQYEKLARLKPKDPTVFNSLALIQRRQGRWAESLGNSRKAAELDPGNTGYSRSLLVTLMSVRRRTEMLAEQTRLGTLVKDKLTEEAFLAGLQFLATGSRAAYDAWLASLTREQADSALGISLRKTWASRLGDFAEFIRLDQLQPFFDGDGVEHHVQAMNAAGVYAAQGDVAGARQRLANFPAELHARIEREPANNRLRFDLALMEAMLGHKAEAVRLVREGAEMLPESRDALDGVNFSAAALARVYALTDDRDAAFAELAHILRVPSLFGGVNGLRVDKWFISLRSDPRFEALLADPKNNAPLL